MKVLKYQKMKIIFSKVRVATAAAHHKHLKLNKIPCNFWILNLSM